jgi:hypothetical protein
LVVTPALDAAATWMLKVPGNDADATGLSRVPGSWRSPIGIVLLAGVVGFFDQYLASWIAENFIHGLRTRLFGICRPCRSASSTAVGSAT